MLDGALLIIAASTDGLVESQGDLEEHIRYDNGEEIF